MSGFIDEYLVKLGASIDQSGMQRFHQALREATAVSQSSASSIGGAFFKAQTEIVGGFTAIGTAAVGLVDKIASADQSYRLFALHMYMSKDAARSLKTAMDALDMPLEDLTWDKELRDRTHQLVEDQRAMNVGGDFDSQMHKIRDIRFEFTRMEVELQYLGMHIVQDFMKALGVGPDELLGKLRQFNKWVIDDLPQISKKIVDLFMPIWRDVQDVMESTAMAARSVGLAFTNVVGALSGDTSIEGATFDFEKFAGALQHVVHWFAIFAEIVNGVITSVATLTAALGQLMSHIPAPILDAALGAAAGGAMAGPWGAAAGALGGLGVGFAKGSERSVAGTSTINATTTDIANLINKYSSQYGVDPRLALALASQESGLRQYAKDGSLLKGTSADGTHTSATGVFQLTNATARALGVDSSDTDQNVRGGIQLFSHLMQKYNNAPMAVAAYHEGETKMSNILAGKATLSDEARVEVQRVMAAAGRSGDFTIGSIVVHVNKSNATNEQVADAIAGRLRTERNKQTQRNLAEFQGSY